MDTDAALLPPAKAARNGWGRPILLGATLVAGIAFGAGSLAYGAIAAGHGDWHGEMRLAGMQRMVHMALDSVGATTIQEDKVHDIIANGFTAMGNDSADREAMRKQVIDLLRAPTVDRAAAEKLRADQMARMEAKSKVMLGVVLDSADQLTPDQRAKLADRAEAMMTGPHGWGRWRDRRDGPGDHDGPGSEDGHGGPERPDEGRNPG